MYLLLSICLSPPLSPSLSLSLSLSLFFFPPPPSLSLSLSLSSLCLSPFPSGLQPGSWSEMYQEAVWESDISDDPSDIEDGPWQREGDQQIGQWLHDKNMLRCCPHSLLLFVDSFCVPCVFVLVSVYKHHHTAKPLVPQPNTTHTYTHMTHTVHCIYTHSHLHGTSYKIHSF